jgi:FkbM family methyltransferase
MFVTKSRVKAFLRPAFPLILPALGLTAPLLRFVVRSAPNGRLKQLFWRLAGERISRGSWSFKTRSMYDFVLQGNTVDLIQRYVYYFGVWEPNVSTWIAQRLNPGDTFVDVGANIGYFSLLASRLVGPSGHVVAIEASPRIFSKLERNLALNGVRNVRSLNIAVSDRDGDLPLYEAPAENLGMTSVVGHPGRLPTGTIRATPLAAILSDEEIARTKLFKIDVEGAEWLVMSGFAASLPRTRPDVEFVVEISPSRLDLMQRNADDILEIFRKAGFNPYHIVEDWRSISYLDHAPYQTPRRLAGRIREEVSIVFSRVDRATL